MIHPTSIVDERAEIGDDVDIGPWCVIGADVVIGSGTCIGPHVVCRGPTRIGQNNRIFQFCSIGDDPQDKKYHGEPESYLEIGDGNTIREYCTMNRGTLQGGGVTRVGSNNWIMAYVHIAHDCIVGNDTVFANNASLAGHVAVEDRAILGGFTVVHQFCKIGSYSFSAFASVITKDIPPYVMVSDNPAGARGINREGLRRAHFSQETIDILRRAYKIIYRQGLTVDHAVEQLAELAAGCEAVRPLIDFLRESKRGIVR